MKLSANNFFHVVKQLVMGGGRHKNSPYTPFNDAGYLHDADGKVTDLVGPVVTAGLTDNSGGTAAATLSAAAPKYTMVLATPDMTKLVNSQVFQVAIPHAFKVTNVLWRDDVAVTTSGKAVTFTAGISGSAMTGGVIVVSGTQATGAATNGTTITAGNVGTGTNTLSFTTSSVTTFVEGEGHLEATVVNLDLANTLSSLATSVNTLNSMNGIALAETNAMIFSAAAGTTTVGSMNFVVPRDYDEATDDFRFRVKADMSGSTDTPTIHVVVYQKRTGVALATLVTSSNSAALGTTEQDIEFDLGRKGLKRDDALTITIIADAHTTDNVQIWDAYPVYRSTLVSYNETEGTPVDEAARNRGTPLR